MTTSATFLELYVRDGSAVIDSPRRAGLEALQERIDWADVFNACHVTMVKAA
jgi:hypothetical protein